MRNVRVEITSFDNFAAPENTVFGGYRFVLWDEPGNVQLKHQDSLEVFSVFSNVETGTYSVSVFAIDDKGNQLAGSAATTVVVSPTEVTIKAPARLAVSFV